MDFKTAERKASLLLEVGDIKRLEIFMSSLPKMNKNLVILAHLINIYNEEIKNNAPYTVFDYSLDFKTIVRHYMITKLLLRRFDFDFPKAYQEEFYDYCKATNVSGYFLTHLLKRNIINPDKVQARVAELFRQKEGAGYNGQ
ncbi:MAG: hypothetical protein IJW18_07680 [Lachnospiraceae bacterium]|nr:hypothetical protein [Lachnospiraceae bacterium]